MVIREERKGIDLKFFELCEKVVNELSLKVYDMDYLPGSHELRLYIFNPETGTAVIEDCIKVDKALSPYIEEEEWMPSELTLEVSSPGVYRSLTSLEHFKDVQGEKLQLVLKQKLAKEDYPDLPKKLINQKKMIVQLNQVNEDSLEVNVGECNLKFKFDQIKKANLEVDLA